MLLPVLAGVAMLGATLLGTIHALAQGASPSAPAVKLYIFDLGSLHSANPEPLLKRGVTVTDMSVVAYLVVHPRGTLLWDSGTIPDELVKPGGTTIARATVTKTLSGQLAEIGYKPADINYLALSHYHYDHSANGNQFAGSTWLVQRPERAAMFPDTPPANPFAASRPWRSSCIFLPIWPPRSSFSCCRARFRISIRAPKRWMRSSMPG
jgi:glyoxylase-like metal-dependent hydrolase (beta-lactamase superfamily II)